MSEGTRENVRVKGSNEWEERWTRQIKKKNKKKKTTIILRFTLRAFITEILELFASLI